MCKLYREAEQLTREGERVLSTDEMTGVQALERKHPTLLMLPGKVERREFEYIRHGTRSFIIDLNVASGGIGNTSSGPTRTEADFAAHVQRSVERRGSQMLGNGTLSWTTSTRTAPRRWCGW